MSVTSANRYLTQEEMEGNAAVIAAVLLLKGWSAYAIAALLANMQSESGINPGIYENLEDWRDDNGYGLVQWTPNTKYKTWADANGYEYGDIHAQIKRILYELDNGLQWYETDAYPLTFEEFSKSNETPEYLAQAFMVNYERPGDPDQPWRSTQAREWYNWMTDDNTVLPDVPDIPTPTPQNKKGMSKLLLYYAGTHRRF